VFAAAKVMETFKSASPLLLYFL
jgi:hypothetical protein